MKMGVEIIFNIFLFSLRIASLQGFSNYRPALHQDVIITEKDLRDVSPEFPRRLHGITAYSLASSLSSSSPSAESQIRFSMVNRDKVPRAIEFTSEGNECTIIVTKPLIYPEVAQNFPGGLIPLTMKASNVNQPDDFALFNLVLNLKDSNDHAPSFKANSLEAVIFPSQKLEDVNPIFRLRAPDEDAVETGNGKVTYRLKQLIFLRSDGSTSAGDVSSWFRIDAETGNVDLLQPVVDDRELLLTVFASDSPLLSSEPPLTTTAKASLRRSSIDNYIKYEIAVNVTEGEGTSVIRAINLTDVLDIDDNAELRFSILNKDEIPDGVSVQGNALMNLVSSRPLDFETDGPSFRVDVLVENRHLASTLSSDKAPPRDIVRFEVNLLNSEDEPPSFYEDSLFNVVNRNADLCDVNPVLRVRARSKELVSSAKQLRYSIRSVVTETRGRDWEVFDANTAIDIDAGTGNVNLLRPTNDLINQEVEKMIVEVVVEDGILTTVEIATIEISP